MIGDSARTIRLGLKSLMLHKLRSTLTTAGILFGVASVIAMLAVGEGASAETLKQYKDMERMVTLELMSMMKSFEADTDAALLELSSPNQ